MEAAAEQAQINVNTLKVWKNAASFLHKMQMALLLQVIPQKKDNNLLQQDHQLKARVTRLTHTSIHQSWRNR